MTRSGVLFLQLPWEPITGETASSSWPTPTTQDHIERKSTQQTPGSMHSVGLGDAVRMWPTPTTQETEHPEAVLTETGRRLSKDGKSSHSLGLADAARLWPTPTVDDASNVNPKPNRFRGLVAAVNETWPTPRAAMGETRNHTVYTRSMEKPQNLENKVASEDPSAIGGKLNPTWVEWLMGFPLGWTDLED